MDAQSHLDFKLPTAKLDTVVVSGSIYFRCQTTIYFRQHFFVLVDHPLQGPLFFSETFDLPEDGEIFVFIASIWTIAGPPFIKAFFLIQKSFCGTDLQHRDGVPLDYFSHVCVTLGLIPQASVSDRAPPYLQFFFQFLVSLITCSLFLCEIFKLVTQDLFP